MGRERAVLCGSKELMRTTGQMSFMSVLRTGSGRSGSSRGLVVLTGDAHGGNSAQNYVIAMLSCTSASY